MLLVNTCTLLCTPIVTSVLWQVPGQPAPGVLDMNFIQQLQQLQTLLLDQQQSDHSTPVKKEPDQVIMNIHELSLLLQCLYN